MCSGTGDWTLLQPGFPIRKSSDHSLVASFPRLIAGSYVLHRLLVPRHPPCALTNLATKFRCSRPLCSSQETGGGPSGSSPGAAYGTGSRGTGPRGLGRCPLPQDPTACLGDLPCPTPVPSRRSGCTGGGTPSGSPTSQCSTHELHPGGKRPWHGSGHRGLGPWRQVLLRKEVIQPHLPVRLPCYDFVPIADPTFDGSLPYGLGHRLRVLPTFVT